MVEKIGQNEELIYENIFVLAVSIFFIALLLNGLLESEMIKDLFGQIGQLFNSLLASINSVTQSIFKGHPYYKIPVIENPITPADLERAHPWMWLRGYFFSAIIISSILTMHFVEKIKFRKIVAVSFLTSLCSLVFLASTLKGYFDFNFFISFIQNNFLILFPSLFTCVTGMLFGTIYSLYLLRTTIRPDYSDQPNVFIKLMSGSD